jgi:hypothetical protein
MKRILVSRTVRAWVEGWVGFPGMSRAGLAASRCGRTAVLEFPKGYASRTFELDLPAELPPPVYRIRLPDLGRQARGSEGFVAATQLKGEFSLTE